MKAHSSKLETSQPGVENSAEHQLSVVKFHQTNLSCCTLPNGQIMVAIKPIADAIGLDGKHALLTIKQDTFLGAKVGIYNLLDAKKRRFPMQCIPLQYVHGWLFSIQEARVKDSAKTKLIQFKEECYDVLFNHFYGKYRAYEQNLSERRAIEAEIAELMEEKSDLQSKISRLRKRIAEINAQELSGQFTLNLKGGRA